MKESEVAFFAFDEHQVRVLTFDGGHTEWVAQDVCEVLGIADVHTALRRVKAKHKGRQNLPTPGGPQEMLTVTEPGLYKLIVGSTKPDAERFQDWVFEEVLPQIRKTGQYTVSASGTQALRIIADKFDEQEKINGEVRQEIGEIKGNVVYLNGEILKVNVLLSRKMSQRVKDWQRYPLDDLTYDQHRALLFDFAGGLCLWCRKVMSFVKDQDNTIHIDEVNPCDNGGYRDLETTQPLCRTCNIKKGASLKPSLDFRDNHPSFIAARTKYLDVKEKQRIERERQPWLFNNSDNCATPWEPTP